MFSRPVDDVFPISKKYGEKGMQYHWLIDAENSLWVPKHGHHKAGHHRGTDFACPVGTLVRAICDGFIVRSRFENAVDSGIGAGLFILQLVMLPGYDSFVVKYSHLKASYVEPGQQVCRFDPIAESGASGDVLSPFLHVDLQTVRKQWAPIEFDK